MLTPKVKNYKALILPIIWFALSIVEILAAFFEIGKRGISSFFTIESSVGVVFSLCLLVFLLLKKYKNKLIFATLISVLIGMASVLIQIIAPSLSSTMPHKFLTIGAVYGVGFRIDVMRCTNISAMCVIYDSFYIINANIIYSTLMIILNSFVLSRHNKINNIVKIK